MTSALTSRERPERDTTNSQPDLKQTRGDETVGKDLKYKIFAMPEGHLIGSGCAVLMPL